MKSRFKNSILTILFLVFVISFTFSIILVKNKISYAQTVKAEKSIPTSQNLASLSVNALSQKSHPYILYEKEEITSLQDKIKSGYSKKAFEYITQKVKSYKNATINVYYNSSSDKSSGIIGRQLQSYVAYLNTYSMLTEDNQYKNKALDLIMGAVNSGSVDIYYNINGAICVADFGYAYSLAYDWLFDIMTTSQKSTLKAEIESIGEWIYNLSVNPTTNDPWGSADQNRKAWNWNAVTHGSLGVISLTLAKDRDTTAWLTRAIDRIKDYYTYAVDTQGCAFEGLHYIGYALNTLTVVDDTIFNLTGTELLDYYPHFFNLTNWSMRMTAPYANEQASVGQGSKLDNYSATFYLINKANQRLELWGWERTYNLHNGGAITEDYAGNGFNAPNIIFFENKDLTPLAPTDSIPLVTSYDKGLVIARDGWEDDDSMMTFFSGWGYQGCWNHPDNNTFTFFAKGESFVIDLGANFKTSAEHNIVQVDGTGFYYDAPNMIVGNISINKELSNGARYIKGENSDSYRDTVLTESTRQMIYIGGDTPYIIAFDYVNAGSSSHTYTTNFFTDTSSTINTISQNKAKIIGGNKGSEAFVYAFSTGNPSITDSKTDKTLALTTSNSAVEHKQATVFITKMPNGREPTVTSKTVNGNLQVTVSYQNEHTEVTDTYLFSSNSEVVVSQEKHSHTLTKTSAKAPTCTESGNIEYYTCSSCDRVFTDIECKTLVTNITISNLGHNYSWVDQIPSQVGVNGIIGHYHCDRCNKNFDENLQEVYDLIIPALPVPYSNSSASSSSSGGLSISTLSGGLSSISNSHSSISHSSFLENSSTDNISESISSSLSNSSITERVSISSALNSCVIESNESSFVSSENISTQISQNEQSSQAQISEISSESISSVQVVESSVLSVAISKSKKPISTAEQNKSSGCGGNISGYFIIMLPLAILSIIRFKKKEK